MTSLLPLPRIPEANHVSTISTSDRGSRCHMSVPGPAPEVADPPVVDRPQGIAPRGRSAAAAQLPGDLVDDVHLQAVAAVATGVADADESRSDQILDSLGRETPELLGPRRALLEDRHQLGGGAEDVPAAHGGDRTMICPGPIP